MRGVLVLALVAGCGFDHGSYASSSGDGGGDGPSRAIDAAIDGPVDTPPPPCPDDDNDGVCNDVDDWPCGAKPTSAAATVTWMNNGTATTTTISMVNLGGTGLYAVAAAGTSLSLTFRLQITDTACPSGCIDQLELGWVNPANNTGNRLGCAFDNTVSKQNGVDSAIAVSISAPGTARAYDLRANLGQNYSCSYNNASNWWGGQVPPDTRTIAKLCVH